MQGSTFARWTTAALVSSVIAGSALVSAPAKAQDGGVSADKLARADALFREGKRLSDAGKTDKACPMLEESYRLDPALGALLNLAICYERAGRTASAWATFSKLRSDASRRNDSSRETIAREHVAALEPKLVRLTINVPEAIRALNVTIHRAGQLVSSAEWGTPIPVDPGDVTVEAEATGKKKTKFTVKVAGEGQTTEWSLPDLEDAPPEPVKAPVTETKPVEAVTTKTPTPAPVQPSDPGVPWRVSGLVVGGVGAAGLVVGTVFGFLASGSWNNVKNGCTDAGSTWQCPSQDLLDDADSAKSAATVATIGLAVGGALVASGATLYLLAPGPNVESQRVARRFAPTLAVSPYGGPNSGGLLLNARF